ncbi:MAG: hypothetical protein F6K23_36625 [Okeania sp. SIO2C9]|uniref:hypothetical protein n=1 Tax=Okeania sp. SIO2C9 TaxID=2607791 RepID=UPI0013BEC498|nr:hypothetical protein [Okeania sp. SIO2C9]NEQ78047.1 hypothetical protein [Okeania sp. SIO2C9]
MTLSKKERKDKIRIIAKNSGIRQEYLDLKLTDDDILEVYENLRPLQIVKPANTYNRYMLSQNTGKANKKAKMAETKANAEKERADRAESQLQQFLNPENSELLQIGRWLKNALSKVGKERAELLKEKDLVHKTDYENDVEDIKDAMEEHQQIAEEALLGGHQLKKEVNTKLDVLRHQQNMTKKYIIKHYGMDVWQKIEYYFDKKVV